MALAWSVRARRDLGRRKLTSNARGSPTLLTIVLWSEGTPVRRQGKSLQANKVSWRRSFFEIAAVQAGAFPAIFEAAFVLWMTQEFQFGIRPQF